MWEFVFGFLFGIYFWKIWTHPRPKPTKPGINLDILLPHQEEVELYHYPLSSNSKKVVACLQEAGVKYRSISVNLFSMWDSKSAEFLRINPAGTVPVLVHKGHPIYESHEQILYVQNNLMSEGGSLVPVDPSEEKEMVGMVDYCAMVVTQEMTTNPAAFFRKRVGNCLFPITLPLFAANFTNNLDYVAFLNNLLCLPYLTPKVMKMAVLMTACKLFGLEGFRKLTPLHKLLVEARAGLDHHLAALETRLGQPVAGPFLFGGQFTLADISWFPIFERMEKARWWPSFKGKYKRVHAYWKAMQEREAIKAILSSQADMSDISWQLDAWKKEHQWFSDLYAIK